MNSLLLVGTLLAAPLAAAGAPVERQSEEPRDSGVVEMLWDGLVRLLGMDGRDGAQERPADAPRNVAAHDGGGPHIDP